MRAALLDIVIALGIVMLFGFFAGLALGAPPRTTRAERLDLARTLVGEADFHEPDHVAILHVLAKRHAMHGRGTLGDFAKLYSATWKVDRPRAQAIRTLPWGPCSGEWCGARWRRVRQLVDDWARGHVADPCPRALHWGSPTDSPHPGWVRVWCGQTRNVFYGVNR